jgi:hypothetical protein
MAERLGQRRIGAVVMVDKAGSSNFNRKPVYPWLSVA